MFRKEANLHDEDETVNISARDMINWYSNILISAQITITIS